MKRQFTLTELAIVIGVLVVLMFVLFLAVDSAKRADQEQYRSVKVDSRPFFPKSDVIRRIKTPTGWLVVWRENMEFVPDPKHEWSLK